MGSEMCIRDSICAVSHGGCVHSAVFEALQRRCDGYFVSRSRFAASFCLHVPALKRTCSRAARHRIRRAFSKNAEPFRHRIRHQSSHIAFACGAAWHVRRAHRDDCSAFISHERYDFLRIPQAAACTCTAYLPKIPVQRGIVRSVVVFRKSSAASTQLISRVAPISRRILHIPVSYTHLTLPTTSRV